MSRIIVTVLDMTKSPITGINVKIDRQQFPVGADGEVSVKVPPGRHTVSVSPSGWESESKTVSVSENETREVKFLLGKTVW